jgi:beta-lactamase regulating signal transducer with metallopeptidase domain
MHFPDKLGRPEQIVMERYVIELFFRGVVLCLLTALALILFRRTAAAYRHMVCVLALLVLLILPFAQRLLPPLRLLPPQSAATPQRAIVPPQEAGRLSGQNSKSEMPSYQDRPQEPIIGTKPSTLLPAGSGPAVQDMAALNPDAPREPTRKVTGVLLALWGIGASTLLIRLLVALLRLRKLEAVSRKAMLNSVPILVSEQIQTALTWGIRRSVILLPAALLSGEQAVCESALRHEQAHIARWDWMWSLLAEIVCAFCWFQPGARWLRWRMRLESERACDDRVLLSGVAGSDYAAHLLQILQSVRTQEVAPAMAQSWGMEERMRHILDTAKPRHAHTAG